MADAKNKSKTSTKSAKSNTKKEPDIPKKSSAKQTPARTAPQKQTKPAKTSAKTETAELEDNFGTQQVLSIVFIGLAFLLFFLVIIEG